MTLIPEAVEDEYPDWESDRACSWPCHICGEEYPEGDQENLGETYLLKLQSDPKTKNGYNSRLKAWVDDHSEVARVLRSMDE